MTFADEDNNEHALSAAVRKIIERNVYFQFSRSGSLIVNIGSSINRDLNQNIPVHMIAPNASSYDLSRQDLINRAFTYFSELGFWFCNGSKCDSRMRIMIDG